MTEKMNSHNSRCKFRGQPPTRHPHTNITDGFPQCREGIDKAISDVFLGDRPQRVVFDVYLMAQARGRLKAPTKVG